MIDSMYLGSVVDPYDHPIDYLHDELIGLDVIIEHEMQRMLLAQSSDAEAELFRGMVLTASEAQQLLDDGESFVTLSKDIEMLQRQLENRIVARLEQSRQQGIDLPISTLTQQFDLTDLDRRLIIFAVAPHVHRKYLKLYAYLQDDMSCQYVTIDIMLRICCRSEEERKLAFHRLMNESGLMKHFFTKQDHSHSARESSLLTQPIRLKERMVYFLLGLKWQYEGALASIKLYPSHPDSKLNSIWINQQVHHHMVEYVKDVPLHETAIILNLSGPSGSGKTFHAQHLCKSFNRSLLEWDMTSAPEEEQAFKDTVDQFLLEAKLLNAIPAFDRIHELELTEVHSSSKNKRWHWLIERLEDVKGVVFIFGETPAKPQFTISSKTWLHISLQMPNMEQCIELWKRLTKDELPITDKEVQLLASKFRFTIGQMIATIEKANDLKTWLNISAETDENPIDHSKLLHQSAYQLIEHQLEDKSVKMHSQLGWDDLILPQETIQLLKQACDRLQHRHTVMYQWGFDRKLPYGKGISMLFTGPPGTGKTMSALVMANEMDAELYRVDLSRVVSKYIGETEKNLRDIFDQAKLSGAILFFDEADALFGKRSEVKDAHDKYANMETSFLLQKMEEYEGITILASNFAQNLDEAFTRRIQFIVKYPFPDANQREQLWRSSFPQEFPTGDLDFPFLAQSFELAGGPIKNIVLTAAFLSASEGVPISMKQMIEAVAQEYKKSGKLLMKDRLGKYSHYWKG